MIQDWEEIKFEDSFLGSLVEYENRENLTKLCGFSNWGIVYNVEFLKVDNRDNLLSLKPFYPYYKEEFAPFLVEYNPISDDTVERVVRGRIKDILKGNAEGAPKNFLQYYIITDDLNRDGISFNSKDGDLISKLYFTKLFINHKSRNNWLFY